jgi:hypothetical protein
MESEPGALNDLRLSLPLVEPDRPLCGLGREVRNRSAEPHLLSVVWHRFL